MKQKVYTVDVEFSLSIPVTVTAFDKEEAREKAEVEAIDIFSEDFYGGYLKPSDFIAVAQEI